ncbi:murein biosynthesis integral membrane protein MurJ [Gryllotalpicola reticulitermitis]|uniref:Murein biosynthesis integral membrane protein MurJ n=1 Tax=Gryllotalpicola reticulitermitis TaxID=1184153 RepID=A0ABV8Q8I3_9MICO
MANSSIRRATAMLASGTLVSRVLGFGRQWLLVQAIGATGFVTDAFNTANSAPNTVYAIISQGILNAVLIPQLVRAAKHRDGGQAYINKLVTLGMVVFAAVTLIATLLSPQLMVIFGIRRESLDLAIAFAYWSMPQVFFYGLYSLLGEVLNARNSFGPFTWAPVLNNVISIASLAVFLWAYGQHQVAGIGDWPGLKVFILAGGATLGIVAQAVVLFAFWGRIGLRFRFDFAWRGMELRSVGKAAGWTFAMLLCTQLAGTYQTFVANSASGAHRVGPQGLATTWLIFMLPFSIIAVSVVTAYFTRMAEHARDEDFVSFRADYAAAVRSIVLLISICAAVLIVTAFSFSRVFTPDYLPYGFVLIGYLIGLVPSVVGFVTLRALYSLGDTRSPFVYTLVQSIIVAIGLSICLVLPLDIRAVGISLTVSIAGTVQTALSMIFLRRRLQGLNLDVVVRSIVQGFAASLVAVGLGCLALFGADHLNGGHGGFAVASPLSAIASMIIVGVVMLGTYIVILRAFHVPELLAALRSVRRRLGR